VELRALIRRMSIESPGAPRIDRELLKLGFEVAQSSVAKYIVKRQGPPSQGWRTFLHNHAPDIAAMDLFVVPTIGFNLLYAFVIVRLDRKNLVWIDVTTNPTAEWIAHQITEAFPWNEAPRLPHSRSGSDLGHHRHTPIVRHGHPGQADGISFTVAERLCRTADRIDPTLARRTCAGYCDRMLATTMGSELTGHWTRMRRSLARFSETEALNHTPSLAGFIITTSGLDFRYTQRVNRFTARR
jgi:hypothetical protein